MGRHTVLVCERELSMKYRFASLCVVCLAASFAASCGSSPSQPSGTSGSLTGSVTAPVSVSPTAGAQVRFSDQPVTLVVNNATTTKGTATYTFEVSTDSGFATRVQLKDNIAQGSGGQTSVKLDALAANTDYYWHARVASGGTTGLYGNAMKFTVG